MQAIASKSRWRSLLIFKNSIIQSTVIVSTTSKSHLAQFHSTPTSQEKWKSKWNFDGGRDEEPPKGYIRYKTRQKRADTKRALKDLLLNSGSFQINIEDEATDTFSDADKEDYLGKKDQSKSSSAARRAARARHRRMKRKLKREKVYDDIDNPDNVFQASFGNRWRTWTYWSSKEFFESSKTEFEWRERLNKSYKRQGESDIESETESESESCVVALYPERKILGLPLKGPLKIEDIKTAFRLAALKWHPDKHQGPSQAIAEEKFKHCLDAYKSLCKSFSAA